MDKAGEKDSAEQQGPEYEWFLEFYRPDIDQRDLKALCRRNNVYGLMRFLVWLTACAGSGIWVLQSIGTPWLIVALLVHGTLLSFSYAASHECAHGTAFKTRWLNETVFWFSSLVFGEEPVYRRYSHTSHHSFTWFRGQDAQMPYHNPLSVGRYLIETAGIGFFLESVRLLVVHSLGRVSERVQVFVPEAERRRMRVNSTIFLLVYSSLIAIIFLFQTILPLLLYFIPRVVGGWTVNLFINTQHMCMQEGIADHRYTTRSVRCNKLSAWLYWNMNFHIEHHIFPMVPFHALPKLYQRISSELPVNRNGVLGTNFEIIKVVLRQKENPRAAVVPRFRADCPSQKFMTAEERVTAGK